MKPNEERRERVVMYGNTPARVRSAAGMEGILCRGDAGEYFFRVYGPGGSFKDYELRHDDLRITIAADELAGFYEWEQEAVLDHDPRTLGLVDSAVAPSSLRNEPSAEPE